MQSSIIGKFFPHFNLVASKDDLRPVLQYVKIDKEYCVSTNAISLMYSKTKDVFSAEFMDLISEDGIFIHSQDWAKIAKGEFIEWKNKDTIKVIHKGKKRPEIIEVFKESDIDGVYPKWKNVIPMYSDTLTETHVLGVDFVEASILQKAMRSNAVAFNAQSQNRAFLVCDNKANHNTRGIIMPVLPNCDLVLPILSVHVK